MLTCWGNELRVDGLSALLVLAIGVVGTLTALYSLRYVQQPGLLTRVGAAAEQRLPTFYGLLPVVHRARWCGGASPTTS